MEAKVMARISLFPSLAWFVLSLLTRGVEGTAVHVPSSANCNHNGKYKQLERTTNRLHHGTAFLDRPRGGAAGASVGEVSTKTIRRYADDSRMPSLFLPEESLYDRYAACLAATEGLRRIRDRDLADEATRDHGFRRDPDNDLTDVEKEITAQYVQNSRRVLRALGMTVNQFNGIGRQVASDGKLREKVRCLRFHN